MQNIFTIAQVVLAVLLVTCILLQARGAGLSATFGGEGNVFRTKRGVEKKIFQLTIVVAILFFGVALANVIL